MNILALDAAIVAAVLTLGLWFQRLYKRYGRNPQSLPRPPGPKGLPLIGNVLDMPTSKEWLTVSEWGKVYGDVTYLECFGQPLVYLNSYAASFGLLERRSAIYSDRPRLPMLGELMGWNWLLSLVPMGERFRKYRWYMHRHLQPTAVKDYFRIQTRETHRLVQNLLESPDEYAHHIRRTAAAIIMMVAYGHEVAPEGDFFVTLADQAIEHLSDAQRAGAYLVETFHSLKHIPDWFPGARFKRDAKEWYKMSQEMLNVPYEMTKEKILSGTAPTSMMSQLLEEKTNEDGRVEDEDIIAGCLASSYAGGADTTVSSLLSFFLALVLHPEVQRRGQEEIDGVIGRDRLPTFEDRASLPYIEGIVREVLRWNPVVPLSPPHSLSADDSYKGYFIPAGTMVIANQWGLLHDETEYPNPLSFMPERWLPKKGQEMPKHPSKVGVFGFGRRNCPGKHFAENSIYIGIATVLATLNIEKAVDEHGQLITPTGEYKPGFLCHPEPFRCSINPRSPASVALVHQALEAVA